MVARKSNKGDVSAQVCAAERLTLTSPSLSHTTTFTPSKASRVCRAASQTDAETVSQLVNDDAGFKIAVTVWDCSVPEVHPAATVLTVWRGHEVRVVKSRTVLGICDDGITLLAAASKVVLLEVTGDLIKAVSGLNKSQVTREIWHKQT
jgi:hypothetical protein